jgi:multidrug efflux pump subunit AcrB
MPQKEIVVSLSPALLREYDLSVEKVRGAMRASDLNMAAGSVQTGTENLQLRSYGRKSTIDEVKDIPLNLNGQIIPLGEIFTVTEEWPREAVYTRANGKPSVGFDIMYSNSEDVIAISETVDKLIEEASKEYGDLVTFKPFIRDSDQIEERLGTLTTSGLFGLVLVVLILGIFLNLRLSFWVAFGIPFSFLGLFFIEWLLDITINEMSLFGMIMVLGILVDDGIVIGENIFTHWKEKGKTPLQAALDGTKEVLAPVTVSIITTMIAFAPYFFIYGEMGQYTSQIGLVVILCLGFSLIEAAIILPVHLAHSKALRHKKKGESKPRQILDRFQEGLVQKFYGPLLKAALNHRGMALAIMAAAIMILAGAMMGGHVKALFFPEVEMPYSYAEISFPAGTSARVVNNVRDRVSETALEMGAETRWSQKDQGYDNGIQDILSWGSNRSVWVYFIMIPNEVRSYPMSDFSSELSRRIGEIPEAESIKLGEESAFGGYPISLKFVGDDQEALDKAAGLLKKKLALIEGVKDIGDDTPQGARELVFELNDQGRALGFTPASLASGIREGWYGTEVTRITDGPRQIPVVLRMDASERNSLNQLDNFPLSTPSGQWIKAGDVMDYTLKRGLASIKRENGFRAIRVNAGFDTDKNDLNVVLGNINEKIIPPILSEVPGVTLSAGGQAEEMSRMMNSMIFTMVGALIIMFTILMIATGSVGQAGVIMTLIPLGLVGSIFGHLIMGEPLSFISFLGVLALGGIIVNDSVVLISTYNNLVRKEGIPYHHAAFMAGIKRFRPIIMTTLTTAIGLAPLIFQRSVGGQFLVPMAISIAFGLLFGTFLTLILLPCVLSLMAQMNEKFKNRKNKVAHLVPQIVEESEKDREESLA